MAGRMETLTFSRPPSRLLAARRRQPWGQRDRGRWAWTTAVCRSLRVSASAGLVEAEEVTETVAAVVKVAAAEAAVEGKALPNERSGCRRSIVSWP